MQRILLGIRAGFIGEAGKRPLQLARFVFCGLHVEKVVFELMVFPKLQAKRGGTGPRIFHDSSGIHHILGGARAVVLADKTIIVKLVIILVRQGSQIAKLNLVALETVAKGQR